MGAKSKAVKNGPIRDPMAVTWTEKYSDTIEKHWSKMPKFLSSALATAAIFLMGITVNGKYTIRILV
jgi:hypothetical protein